MVHDYTGRLSIGGDPTDSILTRNGTFLCEDVDGDWLGCAWLLFVSQDLKAGRHACLLEFPIFPAARWSGGVRLGSLSRQL